MLLDRYFETIDKLYAKIRETQRGNVLQAGRLIAKSVQNGACVHIFDTGHIINSELVERGGGLMLYKPFKYSLNVENPVRPRDRSHINTSMEGLAAYALRASGALPGDVMIIGSVSGKTMNVIDLAIEAKNSGLKLLRLLQWLIPLRSNRSIQAENGCSNVQILFLIIALPRRKR